MEAVLNYLEPYKQRDLDLFKMAIRLPGISIHWDFGTIDNGRTKFHLFHLKDADMSKAMRVNLMGGICQIFNRCQIKTESPIHKDLLIKVISIQDFDANSLYLSCTAMDLPMGVPCVYCLNEQKM